MMVFVYLHFFNVIAISFVIISTIFALGCITWYVIKAKKEFVANSKSKSCISN